MQQQTDLERISQLLARLPEQVKILNSNGEFSINIHAENMLIKVLDELYDCKLKNTNYTGNKSYPGIDLGDKEKRIAFQVTSTAKMDNSIVSDNIGMISYLTEGRFLDLSGRASTSIARSKVDHSFSPPLVGELSRRQNIHRGPIARRFLIPMRCCQLA